MSAPSDEANRRAHHPRHGQTLGSWPAAQPPDTLLSPEHPLQGEAGLQFAAQPGHASWLLQVCTD